MPDVLLEAAIKQFGEHGLAGASTRAIAAEAGTAMSTITYRFGGKDGLYLAAAGYIAESAAARMGPVLSNSPADPIDHVVAVIARFAALMLGDEVIHWSRFIVREQMQPTEAFGILWGGMMSRTLDLLAERIMQATGNADPREARVTAITLMGQALVFRAGRATTLRALRRESLTEVDIEQIQARLEANVRAILRRPEDR